MNKNKYQNLNRREKEMGLEIYWLEKILGEKSDFTDAENNEYLLQFIKINGSRIRNMLDSLSDRELDKKFNQLPYEIKECINNRDLSGLNIYGAA
jgi:hypothetical protein